MRKPGSQIYLPSLEFQPLVKLLGREEKNYHTNSPGIFSLMLSHSKLRAEAVPVNIIRLQLEFQF